MLKDVTLLEELAEQDLAQVNGGTAGAIVYVAVSVGLGNKGWFCTVSKECQNNCSS
ncbi:plantaricin C family lantibiotic [Rothia dentocariosa]